jgi:hypothetical protein
MAPQFKGILLNPRFATPLGWLYQVEWNFEGWRKGSILAENGHKNGVLVTAPVHMEPISEYERGVIRETDKLLSRMIKTKGRI